MNNIKYFIEKVLKKIPDSSWEAVNNKLLLTRYIHECREIKKWLEKNHKLKQPHVLDFGCGEGQTVIILKELGLETTGLELRHHQSWDKIGNFFKTYDGINLPFKHDSFDAIASFGVLEHIGPSPENKKKTDFAINQKARLECLTNLKDILKPNGLLFIYNFPNKYSPVELGLELFGNRFKLPRHKGSEKQSLKQVKRLVEKAGYEILFSRRNYFLPSSLGSLSPVLLKFINKHYPHIHSLDRFLDKITFYSTGQAISVIAQKH